jgi:drug/metabolite transporter (DMT)-like permease
MNVCKNSGLADAKAQLYMLFYYLGPALLLPTIVLERDRNNSGSSSIPTKKAVLHGCCIACFDIAAQTLNYTGAAMAGSTIFSVIYSSVTIWTALWSRLFLKRSLTWTQWFAVLVVCGGLVFTATTSKHLGQNVITGSLLVVVGSAMHGATYVFSEAIMSRGVPQDRLTVRQNAAVQSSFALAVLGLWQLVYTLPRWDRIVIEPARLAGTTLVAALATMLGFSLVNLLHSVTFLHTVKHCPGGATSAGVMKGLQAVLVFVATHVLFCGRSGGEEMCFSIEKLISLTIVVGGVTIFGVATEHGENNAVKSGYARIGNTSYVADADLRKEGLHVGAVEGV